MIITILAPRNRFLILLFWKPVRLYEISESWLWTGVYPFLGIKYGPPIQSLKEENTMVSRMENYLIKNSNNVVNLICTKKIPLNKMFGLSKRFPGIFQSCTGLFYSFLFSSSL